MSFNRRSKYHELITDIFLEWEIELYGIADLEGIVTPADDTGGNFPKAVSFAVMMNPDIMANIRSGPNERYADEYRRVNGLINKITSTLEAEIRTTGFKSHMIPASDRTDPVHIKGDFPHKTAATRAGLGWIGRNCLLITKTHGPWLRLGTVLTDLPVNCNTPITKHYCGKCRKCVDSCPEGALIGHAWQPDVQREDLLDVLKCDEWKKKHYFQFNEGHNCGICAAVCPFGK
jgi:epoxyqueuosine reductase